MFVAVLVTIALSALPGEGLYVDAVDLHNDGQFGEAAKAFLEIGERDVALSGYAQIWAARCFKAVGDKQRAYAILSEVANGEGSAARLARFESGLILIDSGHAEEAADAFESALTYDAELWWMDQYRRSAAEAYIKYDETRPRGMAYFRNVVENTNLIAPRLNAAALLAESPAAADRMAAALAYARSRKYEDAARVASGVAPLVIQQPELLAQWRHLSGALLFGNSKFTEGAKVLESVAEEYPDSTWARAALAYLARTLAGAGRYGDAQRVAARLEQMYPDSDDAFAARLAIAESMVSAKLASDAAVAFAGIETDYAGHSRLWEAQLKAAKFFGSNDRTDEALAAYDRVRDGTGPQSARVEAAFASAAMREAMGKNEEALVDYRAAADAGITLYYGHRSEALLADKRGEATVLPVMHRIPESVVLPIKRPIEPIPKVEISDVRIERLRFFSLYGFPEAEWEMAELLPELQGDRAAEIYWQIGESGNAYSAMQVADARGWGVEADGSQSTSRLRIRYPRAYWPVVVELGREMNVDPYLILAVARQESTYRPALTSVAGARGVMQLMPATADWLAKVDPRISRKDSEMLMRPPHSLRLGAAYLNRMLDKYDGNAVYAVAAYNGGPGNCDKWIRAFGSLPTAEFIESIPFSETRDYVKRVLANYMTYYSVYPATSEE